VALESALLARWYGRPGALLLLLPLAWLFAGLQHLRSRLGNKASPPVPVIVVGNITVGGTGKTPLVIALVRELRERGHRPGVIARGYGGSGPFPLLVDATTLPVACGDEPALVARETSVPVVVAPRRIEALRRVLETGVDVVISDDGLQHVALPRSVEIVVIDHRRRLGNGHCLPVGPLREPASRLGKVDFVVGNGGDAGVGAVPMQLQPVAFRKLRAPSETLTPAQFLLRFGSRVRAIAGIGNPPRFFDTLRRMGLDVSEYPLPDHHAFSDRDLREHAGHTLVMTAKDAVKCGELPAASLLEAWYLSVDAALPPGFFDDVCRRAGLGPHCS
jgi:tetraacyldisaccharide 4'-kinase